MNVLCLFEQRERLPVVVDSLHTIALLMSHDPEKAVRAGLRFPPALFRVLDDLDDVLLRARRSDDAGHRSAA